MIDRSAVEAYDRFWPNVPACTLPTHYVATGFRRRARVLSRQSTAPDHHEECDVVVAGGGPSGTLVGAALAARGHRVLLLERNTQHACGSTWNLSHEEFEDLVRCPVLSERQWRELVVGDYNRGVFRLYDEACTVPPHQHEYRFDYILNLSLDEERFFRLLGSTPNLTVRPDCAADLAGVTAQAAYVRYTRGHHESVVKARLFIDARGWTSPLSGLANDTQVVESVYNMIGIHTSQRIPWITEPSLDRPLGLICATYGDEIDSPAGMVQPILERFTDFMVGGEDRGNVIYYFTRTARAAPLSPMFDELVRLVGWVADDFDEGMVDRTYFGHAAGYYQPRMLEKRRLQCSAGERTLLLGVAARQYSGLTGCAFGALARNARHLCDRLAETLSRDDLSFAALNRIDIDPRERASQSITDLFAGTMELDPYEQEGTVNRDWRALVTAADELPAKEKCDIFRDRIRLSTLNRMLGICAGRPEVIEVLLRNNRGHVGLVLSTFLRAYLKLLRLEIGLSARRRKAKYVRGVTAGALNAPAFALNAGAFALRSRRAAASLEARRKKPRR